MAGDDRDTLVERWIRRCKNQPVLAVVIFLAIVVGALATLGDSAVKLRKLIDPEGQQASQPATGRIDLVASREELEKLQREVPLRRERIAEDEAALDRARAAINEGAERLRDAKTSYDEAYGRDRIASGQKFISDIQPRVDEFRTSLEAVEARIAVLKQRIAEAN